jgi:hypothetical protein
MKFLLLIGFMQDGYKSDYNHCHYYGSGPSYCGRYLQQVQMIDGSGGVSVVCR